jgi:hypothetical protein
MPFSLRFYVYNKGKKYSQCEQHDPRNALVKIYIYIYIYISVCVCVCVCVCVSKISAGPLVRLRSDPTFMMDNYGYILFIYLFWSWNIQYLIPANRKLRCCKT